MAVYRSTLPNFYSDKGGSYVSVGAVVPTLVGVNTDKTNSVFTQDHEYDYRGYLYCDGAEYFIKDYPTLYQAIGNEYVKTTDLQRNSLTFVYHGPPGTIHRSFVDSGNLYIEVYGQQKTHPDGTIYYDRVIPNNASIQFPVLASMPTGGILSEDAAYLLNYTQADQVLAQENDTHVYRVLVTDTIGGGGGGNDPGDDESQGGTVTWQISSPNLINDGGDYFVLPTAHAGTIPEVDPNTYDPLTGTGYPTGYTTYPGARNDTLALDWSQLVGLPDGSTIDSYEILLEDLSTNGTYDNPDTGETETTFVHWWVKNIPSSTTSITVNGIWPSGVTFEQNEVQKSSVGTSPDWVNNGYSGPQPPVGERHIYRLYVKAYLTDGQSLVQSLDFVFGDGPVIPVGVVKEPYFDVNIDIEGGDSGIDPGEDPQVSDLNVDFTAFSPQSGNPPTGHPTVRIRKPFLLSDYPYILGKFRVPDYRDRKLIGFGEGVEGAGTPLVEDRITMNIGDVGGRWYISTDTINTPAEFFEISDVITTGYDQVTTQIEPYLVGEKKYVVGPIQDYIFNKPPTHDHLLLHSQPDEQTDAPISGVDTYTSNYVRYKGAVEQFNPGGDAGDGTAKGHSHGLLGDRPSNARISTYGNTDGIGESVPAGDGTCLAYRITEAPAVDLVQVNGDGSFIYASTASDHGFSAGDAVIIFDTGNPAVEGSYEVIAEGLTGTTFRAVSTFNGSVAGGKVREAAGFFEPQTYTPDPRVYVVDDATVIGGKVIPGVNVGIGEVRYDQSYTSGTHTIPALARTSSFEFFIYAGGGGGGGSTGNGTAGGNSSLSLFVDGVSYTISATGGQPGRSGNSGGAGGNGGSVSIPAVIMNDDRFNINNLPGQNGTSGAGGGAGGASAYGKGGDGGQSVTIIRGTTSNTFYSSGSFNSSTGLPAGASVQNVTISVSGAGGGRGNTNANSGCGGGSIGGSASPGRRVQGTYNGGGSFTHQIGTQGGQGFNNQGGSSKSAESTNYNVGSGPSIGGSGGRGARGNGATGGAGGGSSGVRNSSGWLIGAGGGGGGGGSGGGWNGGSITDPCWTGGPGLGPSQGTYIANSIGPGNGGSGGISGCTAGGGGGGGGGFGPAGGGGGGQGGVAGAGHVNTGSGSGGRAGRSAARSILSGIFETSGNSGGGSVSYVVTYQGTVTNPKGGGGGAGGAVTIGYAVNDYINEDISTQIVLSVGGGGSAGAGEGNAGGGGFIQVKAYEIVATEVGEAELTSPRGRYYEVPGMPTDTPDFPDTFITDNIWHSASPGVNVRSSTGSNFPLATQRSDGKATRFIEFSGAGNRFLQLGPLNLAAAEQIIFTVIKGNGSNGGDAPEENLMCYLKTSIDTPTENLVEAVATAGSGPAGYSNYIIDLDPENDARANGVYLVIRQDRPEAAGDNDDVPGGLTNDNWGLAQFGVVYGEVTENVFVPSSDATLPGNEGTCGPDAGINVIRRTVSANASNIRFTDGLFTLTGSTPVSVTAEARTTEDIPLITRYHRAKYLIKAF